MKFSLGLLILSSVSFLPRRTIGEDVAQRRRVTCTTVRHPQSDLPRLWDCQRLRDDLFRSPIAYDKIMYGRGFDNNVTHHSLPAVWRLAAHMRSSCALISDVIKDPSAVDMFSIKDVAYLSEALMTYCLEKGQLGYGFPGRTAKAYVGIAKIDPAGNTLTLPTGGVINLNQMAVVQIPDDPISNNTILLATSVNTKDTE